MIGYTRESCASPGDEIRGRATRARGELYRSWAFWGEGEGRPEGKTKIEMTDGEEEEWMGGKERDRMQPQRERRERVEGLAGKV